MHNFTEISLYVPEYRHLIQSGALSQTLEANCSQSGWSMKNPKDPFCLLAIEILCTDLCDFWTKNGGVLSKNVFWTIPPGGGAVTSPSDKKRSEVLLRHLGSVRAKFHCNRTNGAGYLLSRRHKRNMPVIAPP